MTRREAKIKLGMDIGGLKKATKEAKGLLGTAFDAQLIKDLNSQSKIYKQFLQDATKDLARMGAEGSKAWDDRRAQKLVKAIREYRNGLVEVARMQRSMSSGGGIASNIGAGFSGGARGFGGPASRILGSLGLSLGVGMALNRSITQGRQSLDLRALTGGTTVGSESQLGFTRTERRARGIDFARGAGRDLGGDELRRGVNVGETMERAFGIGGGEFGQAVGAARRAGVKNETKFITDSIGDAVANGLSGSSVGEYLQQMTHYLESVSKGVDVNEASLRGFASSLGEMDFFRKDPARIFDAIMSLDKTFQSGDAFQQFLSYRSFQTASGISGGSTPAAFQVRQKLGLFGEDKNLSEEFRRMGMADLAAAVGTSGNKIVEGMLTTAFRDSMADGRSGTAASNIFMETSGLTNRQGLEIFKKFSQQQQAGKPLRLSDRDMERVREGLMTPEERAEKAMANFDGNVVKFGKRVDDLQNKVSDTLSEAVTKFVGAVDEFAKIVGIEEDITKLIAILAAGAGLNAIGGRAGGGKGGGVTGIGAAGAAVVGIISLPLAAEAGEAIGKAMRKQLDEWTSGAWSGWWDKFWNEDRNNEDRAITNYQSSLIGAAGAEGVPLSMKGAQGIAKSLGEKEAGLRKRGLSEESVQQRMNAEVDSKVRDLKKRHAGFVELQRYRAEGGGFDLSSAPPEDRRRLQRELLKFPESRSIFLPSGEEPLLSEDPYRQVPGAMQRGGRARRMQRGGYTHPRSRVRRMSMGGPVDSIHTMLTAGEFVVNAADTSRNLPALIHANNGGLVQAIGDGARSSPPPPPDDDDLSDDDLRVIPAEVVAKAGDRDNTEATHQNTQALMALAQAISQANRSRGFPRGGEVMLGRA